MTPSARMMRNAALRNIWYSWSDSVCEGATTMESPVWTPIGSKFSMLQIVIQVSAASRITSYSISFQPSNERSTRTCPTGLASMPDWVTTRSCSQVNAVPPPVPPRVNAGRMMSGSPISTGTLMMSVPPGASTSDKRASAGSQSTTCSNTSMQNTASYRRR